jgi:hypothetical protein
LQLELTPDFLHSLQGNVLGSIRVFGIRIHFPPDNLHSLVQEFVGVVVDPLELLDGVDFFLHQFAGAVQVDVIGHCDL